MHVSYHTIIVGLRRLTFAEDAIRVSGVYTEIRSALLVRWMEAIIPLQLVGSLKGYFFLAGQNCMFWRGVGDFREQCRVSRGAARSPDVHFAVDVVFLRADLSLDVRDQLLDSVAAPTQDSG